MEILRDRHMGFAFVFFRELYGFQRLLSEVPY